MPLQDDKTHRVEISQAEFQRLGKMLEDDNRLGTKGDRLISSVPFSSLEWMRPASGQRCHVNARGRYEGDCAAGWVKAKEFGEFSIGMSIGAPVHEADESTTPSASAPLSP